MPLQGLYSYIHTLAGVLWQHSWVVVDLFSHWKQQRMRMLAAEVMLLLALVVLQAEGYYRCCRGMCYKQCGNTGCLCTNNAKCTEDNECAPFDTCSSSCTLPSTYCPDQPLQCYGRYCWKQCGEENSWCTDYADIQCLRNSQCSSFNCTKPCISINQYECTTPESYTGISFRCYRGICYRQCHGTSNWCTRFNSCEGSDTCEPFDKCETTCAKL